MKKKPMDEDLKFQGIGNLVRKVVQHCQRGQLGKAEEICGTILEACPNHPQISHLVPRIKELRRKHTMVAGWINKAMRVDVPDSCYPKKARSSAQEHEKQIEPSSPLMISVIVCSAQDPTWEMHEKHVRRTIGCPHEYVRINNTKKRLGICAAYNLGAERASGDIFVFVHEDVFFITPNWGSVLQNKFTMDKSLGLVGVAGTQYLYPHNPRWNAAGRPFVFGRVIHARKNEKKCYLTVFSEEDRDTEVAGVDGLLLAIKSSLFETIRFDEDTFDGFHFYDLDICMQIRETQKLITTHDILVKHWSLGACDGIWQEYGKQFLKKYRDRLPVSTVTGGKTPDTKDAGPIESFELSHILPSKTLHYINNIEKEF
jgi:GT2 family glycosyltransferase